MNKLAFFSVVFMASLAFAAPEPMKFKLPPPSVRVAQADTTATSSASYTTYAPAESEQDLRAVVITNVDQLAKAQANIAVNVMLTSHAGVALGYQSGSNREKREKLGNQEFTVDRTVTNIGIATYIWPVESRKNISIVPSMVFRSEKDLVDTDNENGLGVKTVGVFKPTRALMVEGGLNTLIIAGETTGQAHLGLGFLF